MNELRQPIEVSVTSAMLTVRQELANRESSSIPKHRFSRFQYGGLQGTENLSSRSRYPLSKFAKKIWISRQNLSNQDHGYSRARSGML